MSTEWTTLIRVLHVIGAMDRGGAETFIMNVYRTVNRADVQFDFLVHEHRECDYDTEILQLGGNIYRLPRYTGLNTFSYFRACREFFEGHSGYAAVHGHIGSCAALYLSQAKEAGMFTIAHSHATKGSGLWQRAFDAASYPTRFVADVFLACSQEAGRDRYGSKIASGERFRVVNNGIPLELYRFDHTRRYAVRNSLRVAPNVPVFCHIGRFVPEKNHTFLIRVFERITQQLPGAMLLLAGRGPLEKDVVADVKARGLADRVRFLGVRSDIPDILMASDVFIFPSEREGLGIAAIEAQATGLPCILSDALPPLSKVTRHARFLSLEAGAETWASLATSALGAHISREQQIDSVRSAGFDISDTSEKLVNLYESHRLWSAS